MGMAAASDNLHGPIPPDPEPEAPRNAIFSPTVVLSFGEDGEFAGISWDWEDSYQVTIIDLGESIEEVLVDDMACEFMDELIIEWNGQGGEL